MTHLLSLLLNCLTSLVGTTAGRSVDVGNGFWFLPGTSTLSGPIDWIFYVITWICVVFFVGIVILMGYFMVKYRRTDNKAPATKGLTHHTPLEVTWTIIPLILVVVIFYIGLDGYVKMVNAPANAYEVNVVAQKWSWNFTHPNGASDATTLKVPVNRPVKLLMTSEDVLHSLYIPSFRVKHDVVPGRVSTLWFEATKPGRYQLFCTEYCGTQHSQMAAWVDVFPEEEFERVIAEDAVWIDRYADSELYKAGARIFARCASCHSLAKGPNDSYVRLTGPSYWETHDLWGKKRLMEDGREVTVDENYIMKSIINPQADIVATYGRVMPQFSSLKAREIQAVWEFIKRLDEVVDDDGQFKIDIAPTIAPEAEPSGEPVALLPSDTPQR